MSSPSVPSAASSSTTRPRLPPLGEQEQQPYKYQGYPAYCEFVASDDNEFIFRRFGALNARVLLNLQHEITSREKELKDIDERCKWHSDTFALSNSLEDDQNPNSLNPIKGRADLLARLQPMLQSYNDYLVTYVSLRDKRYAREYQVLDLKAWLDFRSSRNVNEPDTGPILDDERAYLNTGVDLIALGQPDGSPLVDILQKTAVGRALLCKKIKPSQYNDPKRIYLSGRRTEMLANLVVFVLGLSMLYGPMWWLNFVLDDAKRLAIITVFVFIFAISLCLVGSGKPFETLAAHGGLCCSFDGIHAKAAREVA